jgi:hypothetical protein
METLFFLQFKLITAFAPWKAAGSFSTEIDGHNKFSAHFQSKLKVRDNTSAALRILYMLIYKRNFNVAHFQLPFQIETLPFKGPINVGFILETTDPFYKITSYLRLRKSKIIRSIF